MARVAGRREQRHARTGGARVVLAVAVFISLAWAASPASGASHARGDFDGDGRSDLAVGAPADSVSGQQNAGAVNVLYGSRGGLTQVNDQELTSAGASVPGVPAVDARFGAALATGDFDGDGRGDLAVGAPGADHGGLGLAPASGGIVVFYGSGTGLRVRGGRSGFSQNSIGVVGTAEAGDEFGAALAAGDFDGDGRDDLAIGAPGDSVGGQARAGAVTVLYGRPDGLHAAGSRLWTQNTPGIKGIAGTDHRFGAALAAGDLSRNGRDELAIGIPGGVIGGRAGAGAVAVLYGRAGGLSSVDQLWSQDAVGIKGVAEAGDHLGGGLAIGDFDGDGAGDLAVSAPEDSVGDAFGAGAVNVLYGSTAGLRSTGDQLWTRDTPGIQGRPSIGERFGAALAAGDLSRNLADDLAIGIPGQQLGDAASAGAVAVIYGQRSAGLSAGYNQLWHQDVAGILGVSGQGDRFGQALSMGDFDGDGAQDLAVGVPGDSVSGYPLAGVVNVLFGSSRGLSAIGDQLWSQGGTGVKGAVGNDSFGATLASGAPR